MPGWKCRHQQSTDSTQAACTVTTMLKGVCQDLCAQFSAWILGEERQPLKLLTLRAHFFTVLRIPISTSPSLFATLPCPPVLVVLQMYLSPPIFLADSHLIALRHGCHQMRILLLNPCHPERHPSKCTTAKVLSLAPCTCPSNILRPAIRVLQNFKIPQALVLHAEPKPPKGK